MISSMLTYTVNDTYELSWKGLWNTILETVKWLVINKHNYIQQTTRGELNSSCFIYLTIWPYPRFLWKISPLPSLGWCHHILDSILHCLPIKSKDQVYPSWQRREDGARRRGSEGVREERKDRKSKGGRKREQKRMKEGAMEGQGGMEGGKVAGRKEEREWGRRPPFFSFFHLSSLCSIHPFFPPFLPNLPLFFPPCLLLSLLSSLSLYCSLHHLLLPRPSSFCSSILP